MKTHSLQSTLAPARLRRVAELFFVRFMVRSFLLCLAALCSTLCYATDQSLSGFYVVLPKPSAGSHYFDSPSFPKLGYIAARPDLPISRVESVRLETCREQSTLVHEDGTSEVDDEERQCLVIRLYPTEAKAFGSLTTLYVNHRIFLLIDGEPICAPSIREPITDGSIRITLPANSDAAGMKRKLDRLAGKP
jgi:hypothetical protein